MLWYSADTDDAVDRLVAAWSDAPVENLEVCQMILEVAREQVVEFAPDSSALDQVRELLTQLGATSEVIAEVIDLLDGLIPGDDVFPDDGVYPGMPSFLDPPARYVYAQLQQATNLWNAGRVSGDGQVGPDGTQFVFTPRPLDKTIRQIIRPMSGAPSVF